MGNRTSVYGWSEEILSSLPRKGLVGEKRWTECLGRFKTKELHPHCPKRGIRRKATGGTSLRLKGRQDLNLHGLPEEPQSYCRKWIEENADRRTAATCFHAEASCSTPELPLRKCGAGRTRTGDLAIMSRSNSNLTASKVNWPPLSGREAKNDAEKTEQRTGHDGLLHRIDGNRTRYTGPRACTLPLSYEGTPFLLPQIGGPAGMCALLFRLRGGCFAV